MVPAKAPTKGSLKAGLTSKVSEKASRNARLKAKWIPMEPAKTMAFVTARWKPTVPLKAPTPAAQLEERTAKVPRHAELPRTTRGQLMS